MRTAHPLGWDRSTGHQHSDVMYRRPTRLDPLPVTARECDVWQLLAQGASNKEIARALSISDQTVKNHITSLLDKEECRSREQLIVRYYGGHIYEPPPLVREREA